MQNSPQEIRQLQSCINDLMSVLTLPAIWTGGDSSQVITTLLDALVGMLRLDFAYARFLGNGKGSETDVLRLAKGQTTNVLPLHVGQALEHCLLNAPPNSPALVANPIGKGEVVIAPFRLGLHDEIGFLAAASKRRDFPTKIETLLLRVAANQAVVGLQEAQLISEQKRSAEELERKIAERTRQVTAVNIELLREVDERERAEEELRRSEAFLAEGQRISHTGSWTVKFRSGDVFWSREVYRIYGLDPDATELSQEMAFQLVHPEDRTSVQEAFERAVRERGDYHIEHRAIVGNGPIKYLHSLGHPVLDDSGDLIEYVGTVVDITERKRAEEDLRKTHQRDNMILDSITDKFFAVDKEWRYTHFNKHAEEQLRALGKDPTSLIGKIVWSEFQDSPAEEALRRAMRDRVAITHQHYYPPLGEWVENRIYPSPDGGLAMFVTYITERKRAEEELRRSEAYLAEGERIRHTGSWAWNVSSGDIFWSPEHFRIFGMAETEKPSYEMFFQTLHPEDRLRVKQIFDRALLEQSDYEADFRIVLADGKIRHIHALGHPVLNEPGQVVEFVGTVVDVTERRRAEEKLGESERRFRLFVESIPHHVWSFRPDGTVGYWNQRLIDYTGLTPEEIQAGGWAALHPDDVVRVNAAWQEAWANGGDYEVEQRIRGRDAHYRRFVCRAVAVKDEHGRPVEWFGTDTDVEERRQAEEALHRAQAELAHVARVTTLGELTASIAHEVNQPLAAIVTNGQASLRLLSRSKPDIDEAREALESMIADSLRASEVINRIRALLRKTGPAKSTLNINEPIQEVIAFTAGELKRNHVSLVTELAPELPMVIGDRVQLQQVMLNLIINGNEAMNSLDLQTRELLVRSQKTRSDGVLVIVKDTGIGLDPNDQERVFDAFFTRKEGGLGLGLSISRTIIEDHGGKLWASSNEGPGVSLQFLLPTASKTNDEQK
jgi:PAS domain S-box-containing protein